MAKSRPASESQLRSYEDTIQAYALEVSRLQSALIEAEGEAARLRVELEACKEFRGAARNFYRSLDSAIISRIDRKGYAHKPSSSSFVAIPDEVLKSNDRNEIMDAIKKYDHAVYFRKRANSKGMRLRYRMLSKSYRTARDAAKYAAKKTAGIARKVVG